MIAVKPDILVVEDDATCSGVIVSTLRSIGRESVVATSGEEALDLATKHQPRLVITDWKMPGISGVDLCRDLRKRSSNHYVYVIVVTARTARTARKDAVTALTAGADEFLHKPFSPTELRARLQTAERILNLEQALRARVDNLEEAMELLRQSQERLVEAERLATIGAVSLTIRHEVNNPLTGILGLADLCLHEQEVALPSNLKGGLDHIVKLARRIADIVSKLQIVRDVKTKEYLPSTGAGLRILDLGCEPS